MKPLARFEQFIEGLLEGGLASTLRGGLEPVEIARKLEREMDSRRRIGPHGDVVPNRYVVGLHPRDYASIAAHRRSLEQELAVYLQQEALDRGLLLRPRAHVSLVETAEAPLHRPRVSATFADPEGPEIPQGATASLSLDEIPVAPAAIRLEFVASDGQPVRLELARLPCGLGRALDNDVPIDDGRVSRHHAQLLMQQHRVAVVDLGSANGTFVRGRRVERCLLEDGDAISLGGFLLTIRIG